MSVASAFNTIPAVTHRRRLLALVCGLAPGLAAAPASAALPANCPQSSSAPTVSCTYVPILNERTFTVPAGVTSIQVTAVGAPRRRRWRGPRRPRRDRHRDAVLLAGDVDRRADVLLLLEP